MQSVTQKHAIGQGGQNIVVGNMLELLLVLLALGNVDEVTGNQGLVALHKGKPDGCIATPKKLHILVSPALRCQQTAKALGLPFETDKRLGTDGNVVSLLAAAGWPDGGDAAKGNGAVLVVGHQPTLGQTAALLLSGEEDDWTIKKGAVWWFSNRTRQGESQTVLRAMIPPGL